jgi:nitrite reductase/ring-hydroxylating ferredoxin subunit
MARGRYCGSGVPGEMAVDESRPVLVCPWHTWEYDLETGRSTTDARFRVRSYPVLVVDGEVFVDTGRRP